MGFNKIILLREKFCQNKEKDKKYIKRQEILDPSSIRYTLLKTSIFCRASISEYCRFLKAVDEKVSPHVTAIHLSDKVATCFRKSL